jgi:hypothetical protein
MITIITIRDEIDLSTPGSTRRLKAVLRKGRRTIELPISADQAGVLLRLGEEVSTDPEEVRVPSPSGMSLDGLRGSRDEDEEDDEDLEPIRIGSLEAEDYDDYDEPL